MTLFALDIPDEPAQLPRWLENHLIGHHLGDLVAELSAVHGAPSADQPSVRDLLGERLGGVLEGGLRVLPPGMLRKLLVRPSLLLELQELVFVHGGPYWDRATGSATSVQNQVDRGRRRLEEFLAAGDGAEEPERSALLSPRPLAWYRRPWVVGLATAAAVLLAVFFYHTYGPPGERPTPDAWGWNTPGALPENVPADVYLNRLADAAEEWFRQRPEGPVALARRIAQLRQGCSVLILAEHPALPPEDRRWLVERCRAWADKLDKHLAAVEAGRDPVQVREEADDTVTKLTRALRDRAQGHRATAISRPARAPAAASDLFSAPAATGAGG